MLNCKCPAVVLAVQMQMHISRREHAVSSKQMQVMKLRDLYASCNYTFQVHTLNDVSVILT
jgi:hypothetical protein